MSSYEETGFLGVPKGVVGMIFVVENNTEHQVLSSYPEPSDETIEALCNEHGLNPKKLNESIGSLRKDGVDINTIYIDANKYREAN